MGDGQTKPPSYRFGNFELDTRSGELRKSGTRIRLQDQPLQILLLLLENSGELVTREQIQNKLWPPDTYVDYDNAINSAMRKLREALGDDSGDPRFIATFARRGYRFVGNIGALPTPDAHTLLPANVPTAAHAKKSAKTLVFATGALVTILTAAAAWWVWERRALNAIQLTPVPLTAAQGNEFGASFSPDGNDLAYSWDGGNDQGFSHVYVKPFGLGKPIRLTTGPTQDVSPSWSPDGRSIAFMRYHNSSCELDVVPALGGPETKVTEDFLCHPGKSSHLDLSPPSWSPDNQFLVIPIGTDAEFHQKSLFLVRVENGVRIRLTTPPDAEGADLFPVFSVDGTRLLFTRCSGDTRCGLYLLPLTQEYRASGGPSPVGKKMDESISFAGSAWTADGKAVIYSARKPREQHLMKIEAKAGAEPEPLVFAGDHAVFPAVAPHGDRLAYTEIRSQLRIWQIEPGKSTKPFAASTRAELSPRFSPDGKQVVFSSSRSGLQQIWICQEDGGEARQLTHFEGTAAGSPRWSPDGRWIVFDRHLAEGYRVFVMSSDGGQIRRVTSGDASETRPSWSRDGKWIYYGCNRTGRYEIWKAPAQGGYGSQVTHNGGADPSESYDGQSLYYTKNDPRSGLWVLPIEGGEERQLAKSVWNGAFTVTSDGFYYTPAPPTGPGISVRFHRFATGEDTEIVQINEMPGGISAVSPDKKKLLVTSVNQSGSDVMIVENFR